MIYHLYQAQTEALALLRTAARIGSRAVWDTVMPAPSSLALRCHGALCDLIVGTSLSHERPQFAIGPVHVGNRAVDVVEEITAETPYATLLRFRKDTGVSQPRVLLVAPLSGHFATLLRGTVQVMLPDHDLYITDWKNARDIPLSEGRFGLDEFVDHVIQFIEVLGPGSHVVAVCQPTVAVLAAVAVMAQSHNPATPRSMTLMAGPIDTRINPTKVNELAKSRPIGWFERKLIGTVPARFPGARRRVYPGFLQLMAFVSMNFDRHFSAHFAQFRGLVGADMNSAKAHRTFYHEYNAVMDLPAEFYLETVQKIFQNHDLPLGQLKWRGQVVRPEAIRRTALLTVEGERDDICSIGQTVAALDLCSGVRPAMKRHHLQTGVGHYGVFNGRRWAGEIYPLVREMIQATS